ncbi:hypothetical protein [Idiomarina sp. HP20-50]|uniref:hypothetical protein n=1 Tax=Idiomarina sp. HP20-50 TaxID=3070813 RepID=UPI00294AED21|nr:hypothetical protein [Idiomarina sp. HP20-50]MDV6316267.1 hypothetical protein [Idiomarina sp. HP20-50]
MSYLQLLSINQAETTLSELDRLREKYQDTQPLLQTSFAISCILKLYPELYSNNELRKEFETLIKEIGNRAETEAADPLLLLLTLVNYQALNIEINEALPILETMKKELLSQPDEVLELGRLHLTKHLLNELGIKLPKLPIGKDMSDFLQSPEDWLTASDEQLSNLIDIMLANQSTISTADSDILSLIAIAELRNYKVDLGSKILRFVIHHGKANAMVQEAIQFAAVQRRQDGLYGFLNPFKEENMDDEMSLKGFHLPMTLNVLWLISCLQSADSENGVEYVKYA